MGVDNGGATGLSLTIADTQVYNANPPNTWTDMDLSTVMGAKSSLVALKLITDNIGGQIFAFRKNGDTDEFYGSAFVGGCQQVDVNSAHHQVIIVATDGAGIIEWRCEGVAIVATVDVMWYMN